ncbi:ParB/RepB/Spo0J family partition protein [Leptothoe sp. ISB3NOV94-8A]|uniref:ParB/RepB/Spo0J family partition protein n=1 Tax=Adonisia turfae CCMR0081 TaxID=2292702 RepID=A0A6M0RIY9_9CYAN|nr:ParB/RepB/Spo0J family partition protein [Adonisia turfae]MDV3347358.1 ParB/RepB/Spo0J family partition protein [Leptothoe sp. LEGE 181152]NEZ55880.1 ParB/RepB/Spo0J family partition protein [Adonisia turfae CCMR0081]
MARISKRPMATMFSGALNAQEGETIAQLKEEIESLKSLSGQSFRLPVADIQPLQLPGRLKQPRLYFDPQKMERLKESIAKHGVLEPILVRPGARGKYEIISGERRWRSCCALEMESVPAIVRDMPNAMALEAALIAHLLNEEITAIEQTESILSLLSLHLDIPIEDVKAGLYRVKNSRSRGAENSRIFSADELKLIAEILGEFGMKLSSFVSNRLPMLNLAPKILEAVREGKLSPTNAVLLNRQKPELHGELVEKAVGLTKQDVMALVKELEKEQPANSSPVSLSISDQIFDRFKSVRKKKSLLESAEVQKRLTKINKLLQEIEKLSV